MVGKNKKRLAIAAVVVLGVGAALLFGLRQRFDGPINALGADLATPFAYVSTPALSRLPRDLVKAPILRDVLTEDFAFYYEEQEDRLSLAGAMKRIAFEHNTTWPDQLLESALDTPAEIAWWPDAKGAPRYWMLAMTRGTLATALQGLASVAADDAQLSVIASLRANGADVTAYALKLSARRTLVLLSQGSRVVVLSDPGLLFDAERATDARALAVVSGQLSADGKAASAWRRGFGLGPAEGGHTIVADARLLSFGYQHFFPGVLALRIDLAAGGATLATALRVKSANSLPATPADRSLWAALPVAPAACSLLPTQWSQLEGVMAASSAKPAEGEAKIDWKAFAQQFEGPAAICWYGASQLHTPLLVAQLRADAAGSPATKAALTALSHWALPAQEQAAESAAPIDGGFWQTRVDAPWGTTQQDEVSSYRPTLARQGRWLSFSPDEKLVQRALETQDKRYPSINDGLGASAAGATLAVAAPAQIAELLQREAFAVLPPEQEVLRQAAERHLVPRFDALRRLPATRAVARGVPDGQGWTAVDWQPLSAAAGKTP
jgi:uncharacterized protein YfaA (DUF2138 family)